ncbi:MAG: signal peptide peptidase SppA [Acidisphaera sp.]|nr:signal peptide peptidase SppA [Acidisphaera sp.]
MSLEPDLLADRRRLKRRLTVWRVIAVLAVCAACLLAIGGSLVPELSSRHLMRLSVTGIITEDRRLVQAVSALATDASVPALVVYIDSPGGSVAGGESLHDAIARVAERKPVVAVMGGTAASAGYMVALPAARIFARNATLTGSIGVLLETGEASGLLGKLGVTADAIVSGPLKDQPSFIKPLSPQGRGYLQALVMDMFDQFVGMVAAGRHMDPAKVRDLADGRAYTGRQAMQLGLVDEIGGEPEARRWLAQAHGISTELPIRDLHARSWAQRTFGATLGTGLSAFLKSVATQGLTLDGAWALWQPSRQMGE